MLSICIYIYIYIVGCLSFNVVCWCYVLNGKIVGATFVRGRNRSYSPNRTV